MIKKIFPTEFDLLNMSLRRTVPAKVEKKPNYKNIVVNKPWGYEYLLYENKHVAIWILFLKHRGAKTSMHCHPKKKTSLLVLEGEAQTSSLSTQFSLKTLEGILIDRGVFHTTSAESDSGTYIMEIETPPEKSDLVRLKDEYGRENRGYESGDSLSTELHKYEHHCFDGDTPARRTLAEKAIRQSRVILHTRENWKKLRKEIESRSSCVISFLDTALVDMHGKTVVDVGEICEGKWLLEEYDKLQPNSESFTVLTIY